MRRLDFGVRVKPPTVRSRKEGGGRQAGVGRGLRIEFDGPQLSGIQTLVDGEGGRAEETVHG